MGIASWDIEIEELQRLLEGIAPGRAINFGIRDSIKSQEGWGNDRKVVTYGSLPVDKIIPLCREGLVPWWLPMTGKAVFGNLDDMKILHDAIEADAGAGEKPDATSLMSWLCLQDSLASSGYAVKTTEPVLQQVFDWGANPNSSQGKWLKFAFARLEADCLRAFVDNGAAATHVLQAMDELATTKKNDQLDRVRLAIAGRSLYAKIDDDTLMEVKYIPDCLRGSALRTIFNFNSGRVQELYEFGNGAVPQMASVRFEDYAPAALERAAEKLLALGGKAQTMLDKKAVFPKLRKS